MNSKKGFTLIELLIVIAIIAVLAVAFLPTLLGAPAKGRNTARIAALQKIQKVLVSTNLDNGKAYPDTGGLILANGAAVGTALANGSITAASNWNTDYAAAFGGSLPVDPASGKGYYYVVKANTPGGAYSFGVFALLEDGDNSPNATCDATNFKITSMTKPAAYSATTSCYAVLVQ